MVSPVDPNEIRVTGENSFIRLQASEKGPESTRASHWRVLLSPGGPGHVLYLKSDITNNEVRVYSDNIAMARWLQEEIESMLFPEFADQKLPVVDAYFSKSGDGRSFWTETIDSDDANILLTWYDFIEPIMINRPAGSMPGRAHGVYSCLVPARRAQITLNGMVAKGTPVPDKRGDKLSSSACLAWSETWTRPHKSR